MGPAELAGLELSIGETNPKIPLVTITDIRDAKVMGTVNRPEIRIVSGSSVAVADPEQHFELNIEHLGYIGEKRPIIQLKIPAWAQFVASKNGKYVYELDDNSAKSLSPQNRVYFRTEEEAVKAGYLKRKR